MAATTSRAMPDSMTGMAATGGGASTGGTTATGLAAAMPVGSGLGRTLTIRAVPSASSTMKPARHASQCLTVLRTEPYQSREGPSRGVLKMMTEVA